MYSLQVERRSVNIAAVMAASIAQAQAAMLQTLTREIEERTAATIDHVLGRGPYDRRESVPAWLVVNGRCQQCHTAQSQRFSRNGGRRRRLRTLWGEIDPWMQRLVCACGGSVRLDWETWFQPYQRLGADVDRQIQRWGELRLSLREMAAELTRLQGQPLALRTLQERLHLLATSDMTAIPRANPPILQIDAIWVTQLRPTEQWRQDAKGRRRPVKKRVKRPIFIALGVWPDTGARCILAWKLAESEETEAWLAFLSHLEEQGLRGENGLEVIIHDGGAGLCAALQTIFFDAAAQRCLFHKLRNIYDALQIDDPNLTAKAKRRQRKALFKEFHAIWQAKRLATVLQRYAQVIRKFRQTQPAAVQALRRDFRQTITYYFLAERHPTWPLEALRTTSRLERFNRRLRRRMRAASAYHSDAGLAAMLSQELALFHAAQP